MFVAAREHNPGSTNTGKTLYYFPFITFYYTDVKELTCPCVIKRSNIIDLYFSISLSLCTETSQLLLIVSDGRGLFLEGKERVAAAVQAARSANIFVIFVVLDNPNSRVRNLFCFYVNECSLAVVKNVLF